ncbi:hypothetical protein FHW88_002258 [Mucilaginibacter sp. SG538B]|nr:hypothetical protein [Mucilaginibacter sp. SG538B]
MSWYSTTKYNTMTGNSMDLVHFVDKNQAIATTLSFKTAKILSF